MAGFSRIKDLVDAQVTEGRFCITSFYKTVTLGAAQYNFDLSTSTGNPYPNFYAAEPLVSAVLNGNRGINHGPSVSPLRKYLASSLLMSTAAAASAFDATLCDYLLYYPFVDMSELNPQTFDTPTPLPRYATGLGVKAFLVAQSTYVGGAQFFITYTNSDGVPGRNSPLVTCNNVTFSGALVHGGGTPVASGQGVFIPMQPGDKGIQSIEAVQFISQNGGVGALVLVKPLARNKMREQLAPSEVTYFKDFASTPEIIDGAYLNFLIHNPPGAGAATSLLGTISTVWS